MVTWQCVWGVPFLRVVRKDSLHASPYIARAHRFHELNFAKHLTTLSTPQERMDTLQQVLSNKSVWLFDSHL
jgi:hypothetical protein